MNGFSIALLLINSMERRKIGFLWTIKEGRVY